MAIFALSFFLIYDFGRFLSHQRAIEILNSRVYRTARPSRARGVSVRGRQSAGVAGLD
jgi:hypothetical protein